MYRTTESYEKSMIHLEGRELDDLAEDQECLALPHLIVTSSPESLHKLSLFKNLEFVKLVGLGLTRLGNFPELPHLTSLDLSGNALEEMPEELLTKVPNISQLILRENKLETLPDFTTLCIDYLDISHNNLTACPEWLLKLSGLKVLKMSSNSIRELSASSTERIFPSLIHLNVSNNNLSGIPLPLLCDYTLEELNLSNEFRTGEGYFDSGNIVEISGELVPLLSRLHTLDLSNVGLFDLPNNFGDLINLKCLNLERNDLIWVPDSFCQLRALEECRLSYNRFYFLPEHFGELVLLRKLCLDHNQLRSLPDSFSQLPKLTYLDLYANEIEHFDFESSTFCQLEHFDLWMNYVQLTESSEEIRSHYAEKCDALRQTINDEKRSSLSKQRQEYVDDEESSDSGKSNVTWEADSTPKVYIFGSASQTENWEDEPEPDFTSEDNEVSNNTFSVEIEEHHFCPADLHVPAMFSKGNILPLRTPCESEQFEDCE